MIKSRQTRIIQQIERLFEEGFNVLDTETTGLGYGSQPVQIGILDHTGKELMNSLIKPTCEIEDGAANVHKITAKAVENSPAWYDLHPRFVEIIESQKNLVIYNASYDLKILQAAFNAHGINYKIQSSVTCAMLLYAEYWGEEGRYRGEYRWQKLINACEQQGVKAAGLHSAIGDCRATLDLLTAVLANDRLSRLAPGDKWDVMDKDERP